MKQNTKRMAALLLVLCLTLSLTVPALADSDLTTGDAALELIEEGEGFRAQKYSSGGAWYIGYGTQCSADDYPDGITQDEAQELLREKLTGYEQKLNEFFNQYGIEPTQGQFDALISFTYNFGTGWMTGMSDLVKIARGEKDATRLEVAQAFGAWCHTGNVALSNLAQRRLQEAALYLDDSTQAAEDEFAYLIISREDGATYATDFRVYEIGTSYDSFPLMYKLGYSLAGLETRSGRLLTKNSTVAESAVVTAQWEKNHYTVRGYSDVSTNQWYYDYVMELSQNGVVNGNPDGSFAPNRAITAGETLKLVLLATGHSTQSATGEHWASGYGTYALSMGYLSAAQTANLSGAMARVDVARLAAKALGYSASGEASPFTDVNDGYVTALYKAGVLTGSDDGGVILFKPDSSITRAEVSAIVWRLYQLAAMGTKQKIQYNSYTLDVLEDVPVNSYRASGFEKVGSMMTYSEPGVSTRIGIDVSQYQTNVDWDAVRGSGVEFVIARVGGRGYTEGSIYEDGLFDDHASGAADAGLEVGAYFFSQAISVREAEEEAYYVLDKLSGHDIEGPVVFDWEVIGKSSARTYGITTDELCDCANAFCSIIEDAGYDAMIYITDYAGYVKYDLSKVSDYPLWYAKYDVDVPSFYYDFAMWQYSSKGQVDGISGNVDMDIQFIR